MICWGPLSERPLDAFLFVTFFEANFGQSFRVNPADFCYPAAPARDQHKRTRILETETQIQIPPPPRPHRPWLLLKGTAMWETPVLAEPRFSALCNGPLQSCSSHCCMGYLRHGV